VRPEYLKNLLVKKPGFYRCSGRFPLKPRIRGINAGLVKEQRLLETIVQSAIMVALDGGEYKKERAHERPS